MVSAINPVFPVFGTPTTVSVRNNFAAAKSEIETLQGSAVTGGPYLPLVGGPLSGGINFGATVAPGGVADLSRHLSLSTTGYGFSYTTNRMNYVAPTAGALVATIGGTDRLTINNTSITATVTFSSNSPINTTSTSKATAVQENRVAMAANNIDCNAGAFFTKTIAANTTFTVSNVPVANTVPSFLLELTNGGAFAITWWAGVTWPFATPPVLTAAGVDVLAFYTLDGGTTWRGMLLGKALG